jgi:hypothetical protein
VTTCAEYDYEFSVWPSDRGWDPAVYEVFRSLPRIAMVLAEDDFRLFRASLERSGFTIREATRALHHEPEPVREWREDER